MENAAIPLVEGAPSSCSKCGQPLCVRKQVLNLVLGNTEDMLCLRCLAADCESKEVDVLNQSIGYIMQRECFRKEWQRYPDRSACPDPEGCFPDCCFAQAAQGNCMEETNNGSS
jgi:hypothetical protein